jgi:LCP family protein required for cell wall assembly
MFFTKTQGVVLSFLTMVLGVLVFFYFAPTTSVVESPQAVASANQVETKIVEEKIQKKEPFIVAILGTDERKDEPSRTDTIMLVRYDMENQKATIVSIPRDSYVDIPGKHKDKINAAHAYGEIPLTIETIENLMGINIDYYAKANFEGFKEAVKVIGGIEVNAKKTIDYEGIRIEEGNQVLEGDELLMYVRFRKDSDGDFGRIERQQEVVKSLAGELLKPSNLIKLPKLMSIFSEHVETDLNLKETVSLALESKKFKSIEVDSHTLETTSDKLNGIWYEIINEEDLIQKSNLLNGIPAETTIE